MAKKTKPKAHRLRQCPKCCARIWSTSCQGTGRFVKDRDGDFVTEVVCPRCGHSAAYTHFGRTASGFPYATAPRRKWFTIHEITAFIRDQIAIDMGNGCPISRRDKERNKTIQYIAGSLESATCPGPDGDIPF